MMMPITYAHPKGVKNPDGSWKIRPVHKLLWILPVRMDFFEVHHMYYGLAGMALGIYLQNPIVFAIGFIIFLDDVIQHYKQVKDAEYHSPLHVLYGKYLYPVPWIQRLNKWADNMFSKKGK